MTSKYACRECKDTGVVSTYERTEPFNPHSPLQVLSLFKHFGMKPPKKRGSDRETTESKYLKRYGKKQPVFETVWRARERRKIISTYLNWPLDAAGRVHTTYGWWPSTWRKGSRDVNLQTIPHKVELAAMFRRTLIASPGCVLLEADSAAIEAVLMGFLCGDQELIRLAKAGVHGFFASHVAGQPIDSKLPFPELQRQCKAWKKRDPELYDRCKRTIHASNYGLTPYGMHDEYQEEFPTIAVATKQQRAYLDLFPSVERATNNLRMRAHKETFLDNHYQYRHRFYDVFSWEQKRYQNALRRGLGPAAAESKAWVLGNDAKRCIAFIPQSDACVAPHSRILLADLTWTRADAVNVGDELIGFDEDAAGTPGRRFRASSVLEVHRLRLPRVRVHTTRGTVIVSALHPFLAERPTYKGRYWTKAQDLKPGARISYLSQPWDGDYSRDGGYLAGFFDGEGWCQKTRVGFGQNRGATLDHVCDLLQARGFNFNLSQSCPPGARRIRPAWTQMRGELRTMREALRFLGTIRPARLLPKARQLWENRRTGGKAGADFAAVTAVVSDGVGEVIAIKTTTATYISDGMFSHNSAIQTEDLLHIGYSPEVPPEVMSWMRLIIHDSFVLEVPKAEADWVGQLMGTVMSRPRPELGGLSIGVEVKIGENLQDTSELEIKAAA